MKTLNTNTNLNLSLNTVSRLSLSILAAIAFAACSDKSSPTGASPLPPLQDFAATSAVPAPPSGDPGEGFGANVRGLPSYGCADFGDVRLRVFARGNDVVVQYAAESVPLDAFYYVRFWPNGRHQGEPIDDVIGYLRAGDNTSGEFVALTFDTIDRKITLNYNVDIEMVLTEEDYERGETDVGQCDRGGLIELLPPVTSCNASQSIGELRISDVNYEYARAEVDVTARNFIGRAEVEWRYASSTEIVASTELTSECGGKTTTLEWRVAQSRVLHATAVVRIIDANGRLVQSREFDVDGLIR